jgi:hypothetical protein
MKTARNCALILTVFTFASGMRYITDEEYSRHVSANVDRLLHHGGLHVKHNPGNSRSGLAMLHDLGLWLSRPTAQVVDSYGLALNPLPGEISLAYAGEPQGSFVSTVNTFSLWIPEEPPR